MIKEDWEIHIEWALIRIFDGNIMENPGVNPEAVPMGEGYKVGGRFEDCCVVVVAHSLYM